MISQAIYTGNRTIEVRSVPQPDVAPGHVLVDVAYTGLCGTDLHIYHGDMDGRVTRPAVLGHEMSGRIAAVGEGVADRQVGDPVTVMPLVWCGDCPACRAGHTHICHRLDFLGIDAEGSMQEVWSVPADRLVALPEGLALRDAALVEPTAVAVHDVRRAAVVAGEHVAVVGGGPVGVLIATVARRAGAEVLLIEPDATRRAVAEKVGLDVVDPAAEDAVARVQEWTSGAGADVAFEVSGAAAGVETAVAVLATRGRLCLVAIHPAPRPVDLHRFFWRELTLVGARLYDRSDWEQAVELVAGGVVPADVMISRVVGLAGVQSAFEAIQGGGGVMKVLVDCSRPELAEEPA